MDISIVYEGDQEAIMHDEAEILRTHEESETYGTMEENPRRTVRVE